MSASSATSNSRWLVVVGDTIVNVIMWDGQTEWVAPDNAELIEATGNEGVGWSRVDGVWVRPPDPEPTEITDNQEG